MRLRSLFGLMMCICLLLSSFGYSEEQTKFSTEGDELQVVLEEPGSKTTSLFDIPYNASIESFSVDVIGKGFMTEKQRIYDYKNKFSGMVKENFTDELDGITLNNLAWRWAENWKEFNNNTFSNCTLDVGLKISDRNPELTACGGGVWSKKMLLQIRERGITSYKNVSINLHVSFPLGAVVEPWKDLRMANSDGDEVPIFVHNTTFTGKYCTGADIVFIVPRIDKSQTLHYYIYMGNKYAEVPSYPKGAYISEIFRSSLPPYWKIVNEDGLEVRVTDHLDICGTATDSFWKGVKLEYDKNLPSKFTIEWDMTVHSATGTGFDSGIALYQDDNNMIVFGMRYDQNLPQYNPMKWIIVSRKDGNPTLLNSTDASFSAKYTHMRIEYNAGDFKCYINDVLFASGTNKLIPIKIRIMTSARATGDTIHASFDNISAYHGYMNITLEESLTHSKGKLEDAGYYKYATMISQEIKIRESVDLGLLHVNASLPAGTSYSVKVLNDEKNVLRKGLKNGEYLGLNYTHSSSIYLQIDLTTNDTSVTPVIYDWGIGYIIKENGYSSELNNLIMDTDGVKLSPSLTMWKKEIVHQIDVGPPSSWEDDGISNPCVIKIGKKYWMWYSGKHGSTWRIGVINSDDGKKWNRFTSSPALTEGQPGDWDSLSVERPYVTYNGSGFEMWYTGYNGNMYGIGHASSNDGIVWNKNGEVLRNDTWNSKGARGCAVYFDGMNYKMWYGGYDGIKYAVGYAESSDGINWIYEGEPVMKGDKNKFDEKGCIPTSIIRWNGKFYLLYEGINASGVICMGIAESEDGKVWKKLGKIISPSGGNKWDSGVVGGGHILFDNGVNKFYLWYHGAGNKFRIGCAESMYSDRGELISSIYDLGLMPSSYSSFIYYVKKENKTSAYFWARTGDSEDDLGNWINLTTGSVKKLPVKKFFQWKMELRSDGNATPTFKEIFFNYTLYVERGFLKVSDADFPSNSYLEWLSCSIDSSTSGGVIIRASSNNGTTWDYIVGNTTFSSLGRKLDVEIFVIGNYTTSPKIKSVIMRIGYCEYIKNLTIDLLDDGKPEMIYEGIYTSNYTISGKNITEEINEYLEIKRNKTSSLYITIPVSVYGNSKGGVLFKNLKVVYTTIEFPNSPPKITSSPPLFAQVYKEYSYKVSVFDPDPRDEIKVEIMRGPANMTLLEELSTIYWRPNEYEIGYHHVVIRASDGKDYDEQSFYIVVSNVMGNHPPKILTTQINGTAGYYLEKKIEYEDEDNDTVFLSINNMPRSMKFKDDKITWMPTEDDVGDYDVIIIASDGKDTISKRIKVRIDDINMNHLPRMVDINTTAYVGVAYVSKIYADDQDGDKVEVTISGPYGMKYYKNNNTIFWVPTKGQQGTQDIEIKLWDGKGFSIYEFTINVYPENRPPVVGPIAAVELETGKLWEYKIPVSDPDGDQLTFSIFSGPSSVYISPDGTIRWYPQTTDVGEKTIVVEIRDGVNVVKVTININVKESKQKPTGTVFPLPGIIGIVAIIIFVIVGCIGIVALSKRKKISKPVPPMEKIDERSVEKVSEKSSVKEVIEEPVGMIGEDVSMAEEIPMPVKEEMPKITKDTPTPPPVAPQEPTSAQIPMPVKEDVKIEDELKDLELGEEKKLDELEEAPPPKEDVKEEVKDVTKEEIEELPSPPPPIEKEEEVRIPSLEKPPEEVGMKKDVVSEELEELLLPEEEKVEEAPTEMEVSAPAADVSEGRVISKDEEEEIDKLLEEMGIIDEEVEEAKVEEREEALEPAEVDETLGELEELEKMLEDKDIEKTSEEKPIDAELKDLEDLFEEDEEKKKKKDEKDEELSDLLDDLLE